jgi:hypothetical protein
MPRLIPSPTIVQAAGHPPKRIEEYGAEYVAVCVPAFAPATVHRDS